MVKCGYCASNLQALHTLASFETLLMQDEKSALRIEKDSGGMLVAYDVEKIGEEYILRQKIECSINVKDLCNVSALMDKQELQRRNDEYLKQHPYSGYE